VNETCGNVADFSPRILSEIVQHHLLPTRVYFENATDAQVLSFASRPLEVEADDDQLKLETKWSEATVVKGDVLVQNGVVHYIDNVLLPRNTIFCIERVTATVTLPCSLNANVSQTIAPVTITNTVSATCATPIATITATTNTTMTTSTRTTTR
jgi:hypothetical protein